MKLRIFASLTFEFLLFTLDCLKQIINPNLILTVERLLKFLEQYSLKSVPLLIWLENFLKRLSNIFMDFISLTVC